MHGSMLATSRHARLVIALSLVARFAPAQEVLLTGPLAGAPSLRPSGNVRVERFELAVTPGTSLGAGDRPALLAGAEAHYFRWDRLGAGVWGTLAFPVGRGDTALYSAVSPELVLVPLVGKANAFDLAYFRFDLHLLGGPALVFSSDHGDGERTLAPMIGIGLRGFSATFFSNSFDYRLSFGDPVRHLVTLSFSFWAPGVRSEE